jgi:hypothetical protein
MSDADMVPRLLKSPLFEEDGKRGRRGGRGVI